MTSTPPIDGRTATAILKDLRRLQGREFNPAARGADEALARIFALYCEILIDRLNRAPEKSFFAFLDMLGVSLLPAQPARVPLTFYPAARTGADVVVPELTQVAAQPEKGEPEPVLFETERELVIFTGVLDSLFVRDEVRGLFASCQPILDVPGSDAVPAFRGNQTIPHVFYIGLPLPPDAPFISTLRLILAVDKPAQPPPQAIRLSWELWDGEHAQPIAPSSDGTEGLRQSGDIVFEGLPQIPIAEVDRVASRWLRCRVLSPLPAPLTAPFPSITSLRVRTTVQRPRLPLQAGFANASPVDPTKDFLPFGERPRFGDTFYIAGDEPFGTAGADVQVHFDVANPASPRSNLPVRPSAPRDVKIQWEIWDGTTWIPVHGEHFSDGTGAFTRSGAIRFRVPVSAMHTDINGVKHRWLRVRILSGDYGQDATYETAPGSPTPVFHASTLAPPIIRSVALEYELTVESEPLAVVTFNDFKYRHTPPAAPGATPFTVSRDTDPACYLGLDYPVQVAAGVAPANAAAQQNLSLRNRSISIYVGVSYPIRGEGWPQDLSESASLVTWEYWNGFRWTQYTVLDETMGLRRSGVVRFLPPDDMKRSNEFGLERWWLRARRHGSTSFEPRLTMVVPNTVMARHSVTTQNEILGSSGGRPAQQFRTSRSPVLAGQQLEVLEPSLSGEDVWTAWRAVGSLTAYGPSDRVYVFDHAIGKVQFGDGVHGAIPPARTGGVRMTRYATGGGLAGNRGHGRITELKTTVPYIDRVSNHQRATGGAAAETLQDLLQRGPLELRHGNRAVTAQDYEDLARKATSEVARAVCVPLVNLATDREEKRRTPGVVSLIIVPQPADPTDAAPAPSLELLDHVRRFVEARRPPGVRVVLVGPDYVQVDIETQISVTEPEAARGAELAVLRELRSYLHPVIGRGGSGWGFGAVPKTSDIYAVVESVPGVDHVRSLQVRVQNETGVGKRALAYPGELRVTAVLKN